MVSRLLNVALRIALLVALLASVALFVDYHADAAGAFCAADGGCGAVKASSFSSVFGVGLPTIGLGVFLGLYVTAVWASRRRHLRILAVECGVVALGALALIGLQVFYLKAICPWCMAVDSAALVAALTAGLLARREPDVEPTWLRYLWAGAGVLVLALPLLWPLEGIAMPAIVRAAQTPDRVDLVTFTDFQCPYCRLLHTGLDEIQQEYDGKLHVVRLMRPLDRHTGAKPAALAYLCMPAEKQAAFAGQLYGMEKKTMTREGITELARTTGIDVNAFEACLDDPVHTQRIADVKTAFKAAGMKGIPATFVEGHFIKGASNKRLRAAIARALAGDLGGGSLGWMLVAFASLVAASAVASLLQTRARS